MTKNKYMPHDYKRNPYSALHNPIEEIWSILKADMKRKLGVAMPALLKAATDQGVTTKRRLRHEETIDAAIPVITPRM